MFTQVLETNWIKQPTKQLAQIISLTILGTSKRWLWLQLLYLWWQQVTALQILRSAG